MKTYTSGEIYWAREHGEMWGEEQFVALADLIAAGVLVPVEDGEERRIDNSPHVKVCVFNGRPYYRYYDIHEEPCLDCLLDGHPAITADDVKAIPVRLVTIQEAVENDSK